MFILVDIDLKWMKIESFILFLFSDLGWVRVVLKIINVDEND